MGLLECLFKDDIEWDNFKSLDDVRKIIDMYIVESYVLIIDKLANNLLSV